MFHYLTRQEADPPDDVRVHSLRLLDADTEYLTIPQASLSGVSASW